MGIYKKIKKLSITAFEKGKEAGKYIKLKMELDAVNSEREDLKEDAGKLIYEFKEKLKIQLDKLEKILEEYNIKNDEIDKIKEELNKEGKTDLN